MLNPDTLGALYLTIFRLAVISAGTASIFCGYRLFLAGAFGQGSGKSQTEIGARLSGMQLTLKSAAPGTCFAFFGAFIIAAMMLSAPPQFSRSHTAAALPGGETKETEVVTMRGQAGGLVELVEEAKRAEKMGDKKRAIKGYEAALRLVAEPLNNLAFLYHDGGHDSEALPLAQLATKLAPNEIEFVDTLNKVRGSDKK
jgi:hypothetical protein